MEPKMALEHVLKNHFKYKMETRNDKYILECEYCDPERPYSQKELTEMIFKLKKNQRMT